MKIIEINKEPMELYKILKFEGLAASGGEAKRFIAEGCVQLNQVTETRKRKKVQDGDIIWFNSESYLIKLSIQKSNLNL